MVVPGPDTERLSEIARRHQVHLSIGITERSTVSMGGLYNANLLFGPDGRLLNDRRKLVPTWAEKLTWASGDASQLRPADTEIGRIGTLICGENSNTLARYALLAQGEQVHIASYPAGLAVPPPRRSRELRPATSDRASLGGARVRRKGVRRGRIGAAGRAGDRPRRHGDDRVADMLRSAPDPVSLVVDPNGEVCGSALVGGEGIVLADLDLAAAIEPKQAHGIIGNYQRFDLFSLRIDQRPRNPIEIQTEHHRPRNLASSVPGYPMDDAAVARELAR
jgi:predicted amidohydrolase